MSDCKLLIALFTSPFHLYLVVKCSFLLYDNISDLSSQDMLKKTIKLLFYLFVFLLPWQTRLIWHQAFLNNYVWEYGRFSLYGTEILLGLILLLYGFWLIKNKRPEKVKLKELFFRLKNPSVLIYWLVVLFLLMAGLSIIWSLNVDLACYSWFRLLEGITLFSMVLIFEFELPKIVIALVSSAILQSLLAIWQFFAQYTFANKWLGLAEHFSTLPGSIILQTDNERWLRAYGSLPHPNILGGFLVIAILFLFYLSFIAKTAKQRFFVWAGVIIIPPALFFTFSRSAWVALIFSLLILICLFSRSKTLELRNIFFTIFIPILLIFIILAVNFSESVLTRIKGEQDLEVASIYLRIAFTKQAMELIQYRPWSGVGIGNYTYGVFQKVNSSWPGYYYQPVHNIYLLSLAELGVVASAIFYLIILMILIQLLRKKYFTTTSDLAIKNLILALIFISILIISLVDHYFWTSYFGIIIFWLILGLSLKNIAVRHSS